MPVKKVVKNCLKKMYPKKILHFKIFFVFFMFLLFLLLISVAQNLHDIFIAVGIPAGSTLLVFFVFNRVYKTQKIELGDEIIVIEGKIRKKPLDKLENERNIIIKSDIYRVGYSRELYGKEIYNYPIKRGGPSEIAIELKDGKKIFFDAYEYTSMQKLFFLKSITEKGNVLVEGKLNTMMSWKRYKHL